MCTLAVETASALMVDPWEAIKDEYTPTARVLDHLDEEINVRRQGVPTKDGQRKPVRIALLAGADLIGTMSIPGVWSEPDLDHILGKYGSFIVERTGTDSEEALKTLQKWISNIYVVKQFIPNDISSTKIRYLLAKQMSIRYLVPDSVVEYIEAHGLFASQS